MTEQEIRARLRAAGYDPTGLQLLVIRNMIQEAENTGWNDAFDEVEKHR